MRWVLVLSAILCILLAGAAGQKLQVSATPPDDGVELAFFPSGRLLEFLSLGQGTLLADIAWLSAIQYYGKHHLTDRRYPLASHLFSTATRIDPGFRNAYILGGLVLADDAGDLPAARGILMRGVERNPSDWMLAFQRGFVEYLHGDPAEGAAWMARASRMPAAPAYTLRLAAAASARTGRIELAVELWEMVARESNDPGMRRLAEQKLKDLHDQNTRRRS